MHNAAKMATLNMGRRRQAGREKWSELNDNMGQSFQ
jgi:hypothetical protein